MKKINVLALFGESGAGKDTIQKWMVSNIPNTHGIISCTTRPKRDYEEEGKDYYFLTTAQFGEKVLNGSMLEATSFNDWFYGTPIEGLKEDCLNIGVFNIQGIENLLEDKRLNILPVRVYVDDKERLLRTLHREEDPDCAEVCRRFLTDRKNFQSIPFAHTIIDNSKNMDTFSVELNMIIENFLSLDKNE